MNITEFKSLLHNAEICFKYIKKDGTIREANGTTSLNIIEKQYGEEYLPKGNNDMNYADNVIRYFDTDKKGWRSFIFDNLIEE